MIAQAGVFFSAGYSTTALTTALCLYELAKKIEVQHKLREEIKMALKENNGKFTYDAVRAIFIAKKYYEISHLKLQCDKFSETVDIISALFGSCDF